MTPYKFMKMFPLFSFSKLISFTDSDGFNDERLSLNTHSYIDTGDRCFLCLSFASGKLLLWQKESGRDAVSCWLPWYHTHQVANICVDPTGSWLLVLTTDCQLSIIPARYILDPSAKVDQIWKLNDITKVSMYSKLKGVVTCMTWWKTLEENNIVILGSNDGRLVFVDLVSGDEVLTVNLCTEPIADVHILCNDSMTLVYALVTTKANSQWKIVLEQKIDIDLKTALSLESSNGFVLLDQFKTIYKSGSDSDDQSNLFKSSEIYQFPTTVRLSKQNARGHHFISAYDLKCNVLKIYSSEMEQSRQPFFVYKLPPETDDILYCDKLSFAASSRETSSVSVLANQLGEIADETQAVKERLLLQHFHLNRKERVFSMYKRSFPFNWFEKEKADANRPSMRAGVVLKMNTVLDGCLMITNQGVYECRPRLSPERLFADLCVASGDVTQRERLAICCGLDVCALAKLMAEYKLKIADIAHAKQLLALAKCSEKEVCILFSKYGHVEEALKISKRCVSDPHDVATVKQLAVRCYVQMILNTASDTEKREALQREFIEFLRDGMEITDDIWNLLYSSGLHSIMWTVSRRMRKLPELFTKFMNKKSFYLEDSGWILARIGVTSPSKDIENMLLGPAHLLAQLQSHDLGLLLESHSNIVSDFFDILEDQIEDLSPWYLKLPPQVVLITLIKAHSLERHCSVQHKPRFCLDIVSRVLSFYLTKCNPDSVVDLLNVSKIGNIKRLLKLFVDRFSLTKKANGEKWCQFVSMVTVYLQSMLYISDDKQKETHVEERGKDLPRISTAQNFITQASTKTAEQSLVQCKRSLVGCSTYLNCIVLDGKLSAWDRVQNTGGSETRMFDAEVGNQRVASYDVTFPRDVIVYSVACGLHHCLALTSHGVFSWGKSRYGQLGLDPKYSFANTPLLVTSLKNEQIVKVCCGQHHSLALTENGRVFSWGWGVFGQLGHGSAEDVPTPRLVTKLVDDIIVSVAAGQAHSLFLTQKGKVYACGCNTYGQLGSGRTEKQSFPTLVKSITKPVKLIASKHFHNVALMEDNRVCQWGLSPMGLRYMLAAVKKSRSVGATVPAYRLEQHLSPCVIDTRGVPGEIVQLECGADFSALLTSQGHVYAWGKNIDGQLGSGNKQQHETTPVRVINLEQAQVTEISCGPDFSLVFGADGHVRGWGRNEHGQLLVRASIEAIRRVYRHGVQEKNMSVLKPIELPFTSTSVHQTLSQEWEIVPESTERCALRQLYDICASRDNIQASDISHHLHDCLQIVGPFVNTELLLRKSVQLKRDDCVYVIYEYLGRQADAFSYKLSALRHSCFADTKQLISRVQELFDHTMRVMKSSVVEKTAPSNPDNYEKLIQQVCSLWKNKDLKLPISDLETILLGHVDELAYGMFELQNREAVKYGEPTIPFSTQFNLQLTSALISCLEEGSPLSKRMQVKLHELCYKNPTGGYSPQMIALKKEMSTGDLWEMLVRRSNENENDATKGLPVILTGPNSEKKRFTFSPEPVEGASLEIDFDILDKDSSEGYVLRFSCFHELTFADFAQAITKCKLQSGDEHFCEIVQKYYNRDWNKLSVSIVCPNCVMGCMVSL